MNIFKKIFGGKNKLEAIIEIDEQEFEQQVLAPGQPAVVMFFGKRCQPCHVMHGLLEEIAPDFSGRMQIYKANVEYNQQLTQQYQIMSTPTLVFFRNHRPVDKISGLLPIVPLKEKLQNFLQAG